MKILEKPIYDDYEIFIRGKARCNSQFTTPYSYSLYLFLEMNQNGNAGKELSFQECVMYLVRNDFEFIIKIKIKKYRIQMIFNLINFYFSA